MANLNLLGKVLPSGEVRPLTSTDVGTDDLGNVVAAGGLVDQHYLVNHDYRPVVGSPSAGQKSADLAGDFETYHRVDGLFAGDKLNVEFQGRLKTTQTKLTSIKIPIGPGTGQYQIKLYTEPNGAVSQVSAITFPLTAAPGVRTVDEIVEVDIAIQPSLAGPNEGRFFVVVEATVDAGEIVRVGRPYVTAE